jgi:hypothetical protein
MLKINLWDSNYNHTDPCCSTAFQESRYIEYVKRQLEFDGITLFTDEWINNPIVEQVKSKVKIGWLHEPYCLHPETYDRAAGNFYKFDFIMTYRQSLINGDDFRFCPYGGVWVDRREWGVKPKTLNCSMLIGSKVTTCGHQIRQDAAMTIHDKRHYVSFYGAMGETVDYSAATKFKTLNDYRFSIVTETCREENLFTEWLLDCFVLGTMPVYWGCPNVGAFFNQAGVLQFENVDELNDIMPTLTDKFYHSRLRAIRDNYHEARHYAVTEDWMYKNILRLL